DPRHGARRSGRVVRQTTRQAISGGARSSQEFRIDMRSAEPEFLQIPPRGRSLLETFLPSDRLPRIRASAARLHFLLANFLLSTDRAWQTAFLVTAPRS